MTSSHDSNGGVSLESSIPSGGASLESILCTEELNRRPSRPPDYRKENSALVGLANALADSRHSILQVLAETILEVTESDSSGISLLTTDDGGRRFYWPAIAGAWKPHIGGGTPRNFGPCGDVLNHNRTLLFRHFERRYPYLQPVMPPAEECLLVPFYVGGKAVGTIWAIMHSDRRKFDAEDQRLMEALVHFASLAYQTLQSIDDLKAQMTARDTAETELRALSEGLEAQVRARTQELEERNGQLADAKARLADEKLRLERSEAYLAEAQRLSHTGSWYWNVSTGELIWSQEFCAIFGVDLEHTQASPSLFIERLHPDDRSRVLESRWAAVRDKKDYDLEYRLLVPGGATKLVQSMGHCLAREAGNIEYVGAVMDITERRQAEEERERLRQAHADLARINRVSTMGELTASLAHEIKQPLSAAFTNAKTCLRWLAREPSDTAEAQAAASRMINDLTRASDIIGRIRALFRKDALQRELVDVNGVIREMIALLRGEAAQCSISIRGDLATGLPQVMADRIQLQQVLMNLMLNGIDAMKDTATSRELLIASRQYENGELLVSVTDTGVGLRPEQAERVFDTFFTSKPQGIGMGLPISRSIIESHGGRLWAVSNSGPGATFQFTLPVEVTAHQAA